MKVLPIKSEEATPWILQKHYAKRLPSISYAFGLYEDKDLIGVVTFGMPASNSLCEGVCGVENKHFVIELNRLCLQDNSKNQASFLVAKAITIKAIIASLLISHSLSLVHGLIYESFCMLFYSHQIDKAHYQS